MFFIEKLPFLSLRVNLYKTESFARSNATTVLDKFCLLIVSLMLPLIEAVWAFRVIAATLSSSNKVSLRIVGKVGLDDDCDVICSVLINVTKLPF